MNWMYFRKMWWTKKNIYIQKLDAFFCLLYYKMQVKYIIQIKIYSNWIPAIDVSRETQIARAYVRNIESMPTMGQYTHVAFMYMTRA